MSFLRHWRIRLKLLLLLLIVGILPSVVLGGLTFWIFRGIMADQATTNLYNRSIATAEAIDQYLKDRRNDIVIASQLADFALYLANRDDPINTQTALYLLRNFASRPDYESVAILDTTGKIVLSSLAVDLNADMSTHPAFSEPMRGVMGYISDPGVSPITNRPAIFFSAPIRDIRGAIVGVLVARLSLGGIWSLVERDKDVVGSGSYGLLLDENGIRIANSLSLGRREEMEGSLQLFSAVARLSPEVERALMTERRFGPAWVAGVQVVPIPEVARALATPGTRIFETSSDNNPERNLAALANLTSKPWRYVIMAPFSSFFGAIEFWATINWLMLLLLVLVIILVSFAVARTFTEPIRQLTQVADRISLGDLNVTIDVDRRDEIGELAEAIARMQESLQAAIERLRARRTSS
jgi:HAMP domain-containing protein